ncbi:MAG: hypothetical protein HY975_04740 [Candidatus Kerfeldbacteria bacterium]|nr:hypothetical protein [Candidatus Kerfeldbacteria bacterium]
MKRYTTPLLLITLALALAIPAYANPVNGTYVSTDIGGQLLTGRASTWRSGINSGLPHVLHAQSWNGTALGTQWELTCATENINFTVVNNFNASGNGTVDYYSTFNGGTLTFYAGGWPWGDGVANLGVTHVHTTVPVHNFQPSGYPTINGSTSGTFIGGCALSFGIANGLGLGETRSTDLASVKPVDFPEFLDGSCGLASPGAQFGTWGTAITLSMNIDCATPTHNSTWGHLKSIYR